MSLGFPTRYGKGGKEGDNKDEEDGVGMVTKMVSKTNDHLGRNHNKRSISMISVFFRKQNGILYFVIMFHSLYMETS